MLMPLEDLVPNPGCIPSLNPYGTGIHHNPDLIKQLLKIIEQIFYSLSLIHAYT